MLPNCFYEVRSNSTELFYYRTSFVRADIISYRTAFILNEVISWPAAAA